MAFVLYKGVDWTWRGTCTDDATGLRTNLTGKTVTLELRRRTSSPTLITLAVGSGITLLTQSGATEGQCDFLIAGGLTVDLAARGHVILVKVDGEVVLGPTRLPVRAV